MVLVIKIIADQKYCNYRILAILLLALLFKKLTFQRNQMRKQPALPPNLLLLYLQPVQPTPKIKSVRVRLVFQRVRNSILITTV